jgi:hypothetical protein
MSLLSFLAAVLLGLACAGMASAASPASDASPPPARIWSGLILATNDSHPAQAPDRLRKFADKLKSIFGYNQFELIGEYSEKMDGSTERWLIPSKDFYLSVKTHNQPGGHNPATVTLFQSRHKLAEFETHLSPDSPLFIRGPLYARGQLVIVLHMADPSEAAVHPVAKPPLAVLNPTPLSTVLPPREKERPNSASVVTIPKTHLNPPPPDHFGPPPAARFGPGPADRLGPHPGDLDPKLGKP